MYAFRHSKLLVRRRLYVMQSSVRPSAGCTCTSAAYARAAGHEAASARLGQAGFIEGVRRAPPRRARRPTAQRRRHARRWPHTARSATRPGRVHRGLAARTTSPRATSHSAAQPSRAPVTTVRPQRDQARGFTEGLRRAPPPPARRPTARRRHRARRWPCSARSATRPGRVYRGLAARTTSPRATSHSAAAPSRAPVAT